MNLRVLTSAIEDISQGRKFYDLQGDGLGDYFFDSLFSEVDSLLVFAGIHSLHFRYFRLIARRFPYAIYYKVSGQEIVVYRVLDCRRKPEWIKQQLSVSESTR
jgi:plasmid stabilization system protein ParE